MTKRDLSAGDLLGKSRAELDDLYRASEAGPIPKGDSKGTCLAAPGSFLNRLLWLIAKPLWQGKVFDPKTGTLINKVLGLRLFNAKVYEGESWLDGKPSIIIDYTGTSWAVAPVRDEIRQVSPGFYLGIAYLRTKGRARAVNFALDVRHGEAGVFRTMNGQVAAIFGAILVLTGILAYLIPPHLALMSGAHPYNVFHIVSGVVGMALACVGLKGSRLFNVGFGLIDLYQAVASWLVLFPIHHFQWKRADDIMHVAIGLGLVLVGLLGDRAVER